MSNDGWGTCPVPLGPDGRVLLGHGSGGRLTGQLLDELIIPALRPPTLDDAAVLNVGSGRIAFTTDSYVVTPLFFPGGDIGQLAVNGTINDLAVSGARPLALSLSLILEEGLPLADLRRVIASVKAAAERAGVPIVTGDTKVVEAGSGDGVFINTAGIGLVPEGVQLGSERIQPGDAIVVSGPIGDHGVTILSQRLRLDLGGDVRSDTAPLHEVCAALVEACEVHAMRDPTRGGLAATLVEIATRRHLGMVAHEDRIPVRDVVRGACELLGLDPLLIANEGKLVAFVPEDSLPAALQALGAQARCIGFVTDDHPGTVVLRTPIGGERILDLPFAEPLPRIC